MSKGINKEDRIKVYNKYNGRCAYCGISLSYDSFHVDHIDPVFRRSSKNELEKMGRKKGLNKIENYNPSCISCNSSKSTFTIEGWRKQIEYKIEIIKRDSSTFRILHRFGLVEIKEKSKVIFHFEK